jgi:hypothetical protein
MQDNPGFEMCGSSYGVDMIRIIALLSKEDNLGAACMASGLVSTYLFVTSYLGRYAEVWQVLDDSVSEKLTVRG